jgi:gliding motility-associated-like protein
MALRFKSTKLIVFFLLFYSGLQAQSIKDESWIVERKPVQSFIENKGQFSLRDKTLKLSKVEYAYDGSNQDYFFTKEGVVIELTDQQKRIKSEEERKARAEKKKLGFKDAAEIYAFEKEGHRLEIENDFVLAKWIGANENVQIIVENKDDFYHSYSFYDLAGNLSNSNYVSSYKKLTYKNLYDNIDAVYEIHPQGGYKYSLVLHPGADISKIKLEYNKNIQQNSDGTISIKTKFGDIIDHAPVTFFASNNSKVIKSLYLVNNNQISFFVDNYDRSKTIVIDPWTQTPNFPSTGWDCVWECERDGAGNVYLIGGTSPLQLLKYNSAGTLQWTYNTSYDTTEWLGTFAVDDAGNSYISNGSPARIMKVSTTAAQLWHNTNPGSLISLIEFWNITFNCDQTRLVVAGTDGTLSPLPYIFDINMATGAVITRVQVHGGGGLTNSQEVRSITPCNNGKYYFLSHDSIGYIHQSLNSCTQNGGIFRVNSGIDLGYKCENWRYNNSGIMALAHYNGFVYVHRGNQLQKRNFSNAAIVATATIPGGAFTSSFGGNNVGCSGIDIDNCGNVYVGSTNGVYKFDQNLSQLASYPTSFVVYDVEVNTGGEIIAGGSTGNSGSGNRAGYIQSFAAAACAPQSIVCCDATLCRPSTLCVTDAPITIQATSTGGTYSASCGACINATTGLFNPTLSGAGTFTVTYTLACGSESVDVVVNSCAPISVCQQSPTILAVSGGTGPYTWYSWNPGGTTPITTQAQCTACNSSYTWFFGQCLNGVIPVTTCNVPAGYQVYGTGTTVTTPTNFPIQVVSASGTTITYNSLTSISACSSCPALNISSSAVTNVSCNGLSTGSFSFSTTSGTGPFNYTLLSGATTVRTLTAVSGTQNFTNLPAGTYTLSVTDANSCGGTTTITITQPTAVSAVNNVTNVLCNGGSSGSATVSASGGTGPYTYLWSNASTSQNTTGLNTGSFTVTVTDNNGCTTSANFTITQPSLLASNTIAITDATCSAGGSININVNGGVAGYNYSWSNGATTEDVSGLAASAYTVTITDVNGCSVVNGPNTVNANGVPSISVNNTTNVSCSGLSNGAVNISVSGGQGPYTYSWSNGQTTEDLNSLTAGSYSVTITDNLGCVTNFTNIQISQPAALLVNSSLVNVSCNGLSDASILISASGGTASYNFIWSNGSTSEDLINIVAGNYSGTLTDANGCISTFGPFSLSEPTAIDITNISATNASCGLSDGAINITVVGGSPNYTYQWSNGASTEDIAGLLSGSYDLLITDSNGCSVVQNDINIAGGSIPFGSISSQNESCGIPNSGSVTLNVNGGTAPFTYQWSNGASNQNLNNVPSGNYTVSITDSFGCTSTASATINTPLDPTIDALILPTLAVDTSVIWGTPLQLNGGTNQTGLVTYNWTSFGPGNPNFSDPNLISTEVNPDQDGQYIFVLTAQSNDGCTQIDSVFVTIEANNPQIPTAFSPNDQGDNNSFQVINLNKSLLVEFKIYNRWGQLIYNDPIEGNWDGTYKGVKQSRDVYMYVIVWKSTSGGDNIVKRGNVTLLR